MTHIAIDAPIRDRLSVQTPEQAIKHLNLLVYGEPGAGKTYLAGTAQDHEDTRPILFLDVEGGTTTIRKRRDIDVIQIRSMKKIEEVYDEVSKDTSGYYKTVVIDSLTELQKLDMRTVMKQAENQRGSDKVDIYVPSMREWGKSGERMRIIIRGFKDLPVNTIVTCMLAENKDDSTGITSFYPSLPGKLRSEIPGFFDIVGMLSSKTTGSGDNLQVVRTLQVTRTRRVVAKDRTSALGDIVDNPSIPLMWDMIHDDSQVQDKSKGGS